MTEEKEIQQEQEEQEVGTWSWGRMAAWALVLGLLALVAVQLNKAQKGAIRIGQVAPTFTLETFDGQVVAPEEMAGKVVLINFWASWCKPCEQEAADLQTAWEMYQGRGDVLFLGVDYVDTDAEARRYMEKFSITYPSGADLRTAISQSYGITGVPETFIIGKDGNLAYVKIGPFNSLLEITEAIDPLLGQ